jgi:hypothetical protein
MKSLSVVDLFVVDMGVIVEEAAAARQRSWQKPTASADKVCGAAAASVSSSFYSVLHMEVAV